MDINQCHETISSTAANNDPIDYDLANKAVNKLERYFGIDFSSDYSITDVFQALLYPYKKRPLHWLSSGGSGYNSLYLIGDASAPAVNMSWTSTAISGPEHKILIIGNTLAELFAKSLGDAIVIEISKFKYAQNFVVVPIDGGKEDTSRGPFKNQRLKIRKLIKSVAGSPDSESRHPILALVGSKDHQDWLMRSLGGIAHAAQEEGEIGQQWNHRGGYVVVFYQNSTMSRGIDVDEFNFTCVHDADFAQPFWSAAKEAGEENARAILNSIIMDETTNSVLRISPVRGGAELRPKLVAIPRDELWKVRYLDEQILGGTQGGRTPDIEDIARLIVEDNLTGTVYLDQTGNEAYKGDWEEAVKSGKILELFRCELNRIRKKGNFTESEIVTAMKNITRLLGNPENGSWNSIQDMKDKGLRGKKSLIRIALERLYYARIIEKIVRKRKIYWRIRSHIVDRSDVLPNTDSGKFDGAA